MQMMQSENCSGRVFSLVALRRLSLAFAISLSCLLSMPRQLAKKGGNSQASLGQVMTPLWVICANWLCPRWELCLSSADYLKVDMDPLEPEPRPYTCELNLI